ncbi:C-C chemokine receptor type 10 [Tachyglossus aculeatus]|uniref:C-C chemokine receptor type 10 n=1 Tax=Tachyglossus aculeatus TaxID=9261 RepID=UPI0018F5EB68|nr:C-C chemokine receptor type 10 [Tachyglossus aculeatus]
MAWLWAASWTPPWEYYASLYPSGLPEPCDRGSVRAFGRVFQPAVLLPVAALGLAGNGLVVATHLAARRRRGGGGGPRSPTSAHLLQLALADLLLALSLPFGAAGALGGWAPAASLCRAVLGLYSASFHAGFLFLACVSADRYLAVRRLAPAAGGRRRRGPGPARAATLAVWLLALLLALPALLFARDGGGACRLVFPEGPAQALKGASGLAQLALGFGLPLGVMVACYALLGRTLLAAQGPGRLRVLRVVVALVAAFVALQLPYSLALLLDTADVLAARERGCPASDRQAVALLVTSGLALARCGLNPLLYAFLGGRFRRDLRRLLRDCGARRRPRLSSSSPPTETPPGLSR